jgi:hypothetical protein
MISRRRKYKLSSIYFGPSLCILIILISIGFSAAQQIEFNKHLFLQNRSTILRNIMVDGDSLIVSGEIGTDSMGLSGIFIFKMDTLGNIGSLKFFKDALATDDLLLSGLNAMLGDHNGKIILGGVFLDQDDLVVLKLNNDFSQVFYKVYPLNYPTLYIEGIKEYLDAYYLVGTVQTSNGDHDVFLQKVDSLGNKVWAKIYGVPSKDETSRAILIEDTLITILITEAFDNTPTIKNDSRYWIRFVQIDTSGTIQRDWKEEVTDEEGWSGSLVKFNNDYIYTTNQLGEEFGFGYFQAGQVVRRDQNFNLIWRRTYGEPDNYFNGLGDLIISPDRNLLITGQILDESKKLVMQRVMKICPDGDIIWEVRDTGIVLDNGESLNYMEGITASICNSTYAVGYSYKSAGFYEGLILKVTGDGYIDTLCTTTNIEDQIQAERQGLLIYPNPATSSIHIHFAYELQSSMEIRLYDNLGVLRKFYSMSKSTSELDISSLPNGVYWLCAESNGKLFATQKLIKIGQ